MALAANRTASHRRLSLAAGPLPGPLPTLARIQPAERPCLHGRAGDVWRNRLWRPPPRLQSQAKGALVAGRWNRMADGDRRHRSRPGDAGGDQRYGDHARAHRAHQRCLAPGELDAERIPWRPGGGAAAAGLCGRVHRRGYRAGRGLLPRAVGDVEPGLRHAPGAQVPGWHVRLPGRPSGRFSSERPPGRPRTTGPVFIRAAGAWGRFDRLLDGVAIAQARPRRRAPPARCGRGGRRRRGAGRAGSGEGTCGRRNHRRQRRPAPRRLELGPQRAAWPRSWQSALVAVELYTVEPARGLDSGTRPAVRRSADPVHRGRDRRVRSL